MSGVPRQPLATARLLLRPSDAADAPRAFDIQSDWAVTRMLSAAAYPPERDEIAAWFAGHAAEWAAGRAYRFAVVSDGVMVGLVDIDGIAAGSGSLGYWLAPAAWGRGIGFEAAEAVVAFGFGPAGLGQLRAGHAADNIASGRLLTKLGFRPLDRIRLQSRPRGGEIEQQRYVLDRR